MTAVPDGSRTIATSPPAGSSAEQRVGVVDGQAGGAGALEHALELGGVGQPHLEGAQADRARAPAARAGAVPGVQAEVVVIAAGGDEQRARIAADGHVEAEHPVVEGLGPRDVATCRWTWPIRVPAASASGAGRCACSSPARSCRSSRRVAICELAVGVAGPSLAVAVAVDLDPVAVGIGQVQRLGDEVVRGAVQRPARARETGQRVGELAAVTA